MYRQGQQGRDNSGTTGQGQQVISKPLEHPDRPDLVYWVHPGFPDGDNRGWGAEKRHLRTVPDWIEPIEWERFHRTMKEEFYEIAFRKKVYSELADLDAWIDV